jgi:hypothetical protein
MDAKSRYPDVTEILAQKASSRRQSASLSFAEKLDILDALRARVEPIVRAREIRKAAKLQNSTDP